MKTAIYGAGSLGTVLGAYLSKAGVEVDLITRNKSHVDAMNEGGAKITGEEFLLFTERLAQNYMEVLKSETFTLHKLKEVWFYMMQSFGDSKKTAKKLKKAQKLNDFLGALNELTI